MPCRLCGSCEHATDFCPRLPCPAPTPGPPKRSQPRCPNLPTPSAPPAPPCAPGSCRLYIDGNVGELAEALGALFVGSGGEAAPAAAGGGGAAAAVQAPPAAVPVRGRGRGGRKAGATPPSGVRRCRGFGRDGERCKRWSSDSFPQCVTIAGTGFCTDHSDQAGQH